MLQKIANTIRHLTMDAVERAGSEHPGMPIPGCTSWIIRGTSERVRRAILQCGNKKPGL